MAMLTSRRKEAPSYGCHVASLLLGLPRSGESRASMVGFYQIEITVDRARPVSLRCGFRLQTRPPVGNRWATILTTYYDLGEFDQKGGVPTWFGSKAELLDLDPVRSRTRAASVCGSGVQS